MTRKNRLAQSGPYRRGMGSGVILQQITATRDAEPNAAPVPGAFEELSSGAALGGTDMRPALSPIFRGSQFSIEVNTTIVTDPPGGAAGGLDQPIEMRLELSDDAGASWVIVAEGAPIATLPPNDGEAGPPQELNKQRFNISFAASTDLATAFPDYAGTELLARAEVVVDNTSECDIVSEGDPANTRIILREIAA